MTQSRWQYFTFQELACRHCGVMQMNDEFMPKIVAMRRELGFPFVVTSGYRCPIHNQNVSNTGPNGPHTTGRAIDIGASHEKALQIVSASFDHGITGIGVKQHGPVTGRFIHLDDLTSQPRPHIWSYP